MKNLPDHWEDAVDAARNLQSYAINEHDNEIAERKAKRDRERAQREAERNNQDFSINVLEGDNLESVPKKIKVTDDKGWTHQKLVDKDGKELEKSKPEVVSPKPKKTVTAAPKPINDKSNPSTNIYDFPEDAENVPSKAEYMASVRESRTKGKVDKTPVKHKATKASQEKDAKEKKEPKSEKKADKKQPKSPEKKKRLKNLLQNRNRLLLMFLSGRMSYLNLWFMYSGSSPSYLSFT